MATNRVSYSNQLLFLGPAPASGYYFSNTAGTTFSNYQPGLINLIQPLVRVNEFSYKINTKSVRFSEIGSASTVYDHNLSPPDVTINFDYYIRDVRNETRMGLYVNLGNNASFNGNQVYPSGNILSGFSFGDQKYAFNTNLTEQTNATITYPFKYRDQRNLFLVLTPNNFDVIGNSNISGLNVLGFGNCYMSSYSVQASVGDFPKASVGYEADNIMFYSSGISGVSPYLSPKSGTVNSGIRFHIPKYNTNYEEGTGISVLLPGEMSLDIYEANSLLKTGSNLIVQDAAIQSFDFYIPLQRERLETLGYRYAVDKQINTPITAEVSFSAIYRNLTYITGANTGSLIDGISRESKYDIAIKLNKTGTTYIRYDFRGAKLKDLSYGSSIGSDAETNFSFYCDMNMNAYPLSGGVFISGLIPNLSYTSFANNGLL